MGRDFAAGAPTRACFNRVQSVIVRVPALIASRMRLHPADSPQVPLEAAMPRKDLRETGGENARSPI